MHFFVTLGTSTVHGKCVCVKIVIVIVTTIAFSLLQSLTTQQRDHVCTTNHRVQSLYAIARLCDNGADPSLNSLAIPR